MCVLVNGINLGPVRKTEESDMPYPLSSVFQVTEDSNKQAPFGPEPGPREERFYYSKTCQGDHLSQKTTATRTKGCFFQSKDPG